MTLTRRNAILSAAALTGLPLLLPSQARAQEVGAGATEVGTTEASPPSGRAGGPGVADTDAVIAVMETSRTR